MREQGGLMAYSTVVRTIDSSLVELEVDDSFKNRLSPWLGHIRYMPKYGGRETTAEMWAFELAPISSLGSGVFAVGGRERERFKLNGGEVIVYDSSKLPDARWAAWMGPWHMAHAMFYAPAWQSSDIAEFFNRVKFTDTPEGLTADTAGRFELQLTAYTQHIAGVGSMQVEPKASSPNRIPSWRGLQGRTGEIWRLAQESAGAATPLLMATQTAVATLNPWDVPRASQPGIPVRAAGVRAEESAASFLTTIHRLDWRA
ncbi:hypothetical protein [Micromonospora sp. DT229]|uniref:hypothetical protein n=1 Tax=Micromonospora sp. DT229 TaxID=3393430 RepID=UPI003CE93DA0